MHFEFGMPVSNFFRAGWNLRAKIELQYFEKAVIYFSWLSEYSL